jgi:hypothetical protein
MHESHGLAKPLRSRDATAMKDEPTGGCERLGVRTTTPIDGNTRFTAARQARRRQADGSIASRALSKECAVGHLALPAHRARHAELHATGVVPRTL